MAFNFQEVMNSLPKGWVYKKVSDIAEINSQTLKKSDSLTNIKYIDISSVSSGMYEKPKLLNLSEAPSRAKRKLSEGDIIISTVRPNLRQYAILQGVEDNWIASTGFCVISAKNENERWLLYSIITSDVFNDYLVRVADGGAYPAFNPKEISDSIIPYPDINSLQLISSFAKTIEEKIQNNLKINNNLQEIAQSIFNSWFIDFDPVEAKNLAVQSGLSPFQAERAAIAVISGLCDSTSFVENFDEMDHKLAEKLSSLSREKQNDLIKTASLFPSVFEECELGIIPQGWHVGHAEELASFIKSGGTPSRKNKDYWEGGEIPWLGSGEVRSRWITNTKEFITVLGERKSSATFLPKYTTVIAMYGATAGEVGITNFELTTNQACCGIAPKPNHEAFNLFIFTSIISGLQNLANGAAQQNISQKVIKDYKLKLPCKNLIERYNAIVFPIIQNIFLKVEEANTLNKIKETLLPKILVGEIDLTSINTKNGQE